MITITATTFWVITAALLATVLWIAVVLVSNWWTGRQPPNVTQIDRRAKDRRKMYGEDEQ